MNPRLTTVPATEDVLDTRAVQAPPAWKKVVATSAFWVFAIDLGLILLFGLLSDDRVFLSVANFQNISLSATEAVILGVGFAYLMGAGQFDLSLGANLVISSVIGAKVMAALDAGLLGSLLGLVTCVAVGALVGAFNGVIIAFLRVNSLIATLGTTGVATGVAFVITDAGDVPVPTGLQSSFGLATIADVPLAALVAVAVAVLAGLVLSYTRIGTRLLAIGSLRASAERAGVRVDRFVFVLFTVVGAMAGLAGFIDLSRFASTTVSGHTLDSLAAATAAVIGGTAIMGGRISVIGTVWGALLAVILQAGLVVVGLKSFYQQIAIGLVLIVAVTVDELRNRSRERR